MKINKLKVENLARLSRLSFSDKEMESMISDLEEILKFADKLKEINTDSISPLTHIHGVNNIYRDDISKNLDIKAKILENAPNHNSDYIKVPKVLRKK
tara:strand:- start:404 stop:697 length:294 start_codon:yes stop_codon:yes gene_type:complete